MELLAQSGNFLFRYAQRLITDICLSQTLLTVEAETFSITKMTLEANTNGTEAQQATINPEEQPSGRCLCGKTSYKITKLDERSPGQILVCHCSLCRRGSGALCVPFAAFPRYHWIQNQIIHVNCYLLLKHSPFLRSCDIVLLAFFTDFR